MSTLVTGSLMLMLMIMSTAATAQNVVAAPAAGESKPLQQRTEPSAYTVAAIIVKSWGNNPVWADLNANWSTCDFTYTDLVNSNGDVVILSDPAGDEQQFSSAEVAALAQLATMEPAAPRCLRNQRLRKLQ